ncbi:DUF4136 domain-containing protein [Marinilabiliaceae bacterium JC017]|nr:DUF4136 domain-containing protein [Marinilabiliaceae bacterium JC017]
MRNLTYATLVALLILAGCYPGGPEFVDELDIAISHYDPDYFDDDLTGTTFEMPDSVVYLKDGKENEDADHSKDGQLLDQIRDHMLANGFNEFVEAEGQEPNLIVAVISITSTQGGYIWNPYPPGYWDWWYWGPGYPGWGWGPGWGYPYYYSYKTGTIVTELGNWDERDEEKETVPSIYHGALNGLLQGSSSYIDARVKQGLDDLFNQAPFDK